MGMDGSQGKCTPRAAVCLHSRLVVDLKLMEVRLEEQALRLLGLAMDLRMTQEERTPKS